MLTAVGLAKLKSSNGKLGFFSIAPIRVELLASRKLLRNTLYEAFEVAFSLHANTSQGLVQAIPQQFDAHEQFHSDRGAFERNPSLLLEHFNRASLDAVLASMSTVCHTQLVEDTKFPLSAEYISV